MEHNSNKKIKSFFSASYVFRLDDIHPSCDWKKFERLKEIFDRYNIKPLIAVIPENKDSKLVTGETHPEFWAYMQRLHASGWSIGMHGYDHKYISQSGGLLGINAQGEFSDVPYKIQDEKIKNGKQIFKNHGLPCEIFVAPSHSFDQNTCEVLHENGFTYISDGIACKPFKKFKLVWIPQIAWKPRKFLYGEITFCLHPDTLSEKNFSDIEEFIQKNRENICNFSDFVFELQKREVAKSGFVDAVLRVAFYCRLRAYKIFKRLTSPKKVVSHYVDPASYDARITADPIENYSYGVWRPYVADMVRRYSKNAVVADLGCGTGTYIEYCDSATKVFAIDSSMEMLEYAKNKFSGDPKIIFMNETCEKSSLGTESIDVVLCFGLLDYVDNEILLKEISRILKSGGSVLILAPNKLNMYCSMVRLRDFLRHKQSKFFVSPFLLKKQLQKRGFVVNHEYSAGMIFYVQKPLMKFAVPIFRFLDSIYKPFQKIVPLGKNIFVIATKQ